MLVLVFEKFFILKKLVVIVKKLLIRFDQKLAGRQPPLKLRLCGKELIIVRPKFIFGKKLIL